MDQDKMEELLIRIDEGLNHPERGLHKKVDCYINKYADTWAWCKRIRDNYGKVSLAVITACMVTAALSWIFGA
jgi:hypothetical protein